MARQQNRSPLGRAARPGQRAGMGAMMITGEVESPDERPHTAAIALPAPCAMPDGSHGGVSPLDVPRRGAQNNPIRLTFSFLRVIVLLTVDFFAAREDFSRSVDQFLSTFRDCTG